MVKGSFLIPQILTGLLIAVIAVSAENGHGDPFSDKPNVIIMTICSVRNHETIDDPEHRYMPRFFREIVRKGFLYTNVVEKNYEIHMPSAKAINTGLHQSCNRPITVPSIFQYLIKQSILPKERVWAISHWYEGYSNFESSEYCEDTFPEFITFNLESSGLDYLLNRDELNYKKMASEILDWPNWDDRSRVLHGITKKILNKIKPKFVHYILNMVETGHYDSYSTYMLSIIETEKQILDVWNLIREDPFYKDNTYLVVVVDHQRDAYYMNHSERYFTPGRNVWMFIYGPGVRKNKSSDEEIYHVDLFETFSKIYGLKTHQNEGVFLESCFEPDFLKKIR